MNILSLRFWSFLGILFFLGGVMGCLVGGHPNHGQPCATNEDCPSSLICFAGSCVSRYTEVLGSHKESTPQERSEQAEEKRPSPIDSGTDESPSFSEKTLKEVSSPESKHDDPLKCIDEDKDGYCRNIPGPKKALDCDDHDKNVHPSAKEICDGKDNDCDGKTDEDFPEKGSSCKVPKKLGLCAVGKMSCTKGHLLCLPINSPKREICQNGKDDDCDGKTDESPCSMSFDTKMLITDYAVSSAGNIIVIQKNWNALIASCFDKTGRKKGSIDLWKNSPFSIQNPMIVASPKQNTFVVVWSDGRFLRPFGAPPSRYNYLATLNASCQKLQPVKKVHLLKREGEYHDVAIDPKGNIVFAYSTSNSAALAFFDAKGKLVKEAPLSPKAQHCQGNRWIQVALNGLGHGVVSCQSSDGHIYIQRFTASRRFVKTTMTAIPHISGNNSYHNNSHLIGLNDKGILAVEWLNYPKFQIEAILLDTNDTFIKHFVVSRMIDRLSFLGETKKQIDLFEGDFIFRDFLSSSRVKMTWYRHSPKDGSLRAAAHSPLLPHLLRIANQNIYMTDGKKIYTGSIDLSVGKGLCRGKVCLCQPRSQRPCFYAGDKHKVAPCKEGKMTCQSDGLSWGPCVGQILPRPEICGNGKDDDCDGQTDENCPRKQGVIDPIDISEHAIDSSGRSLVIYNSGRALFGSLFDSTGKVINPFLSFGSPLKNKAFPLLKMEPTTGQFVIAWISAEFGAPRAGHLTLQIFDSKAHPLSSPIEIAPHDSRSFFDLAIDRSGTVAIAYRKIGAPIVFLALYKSNGSPIKREMIAYSNAYSKNPSSAIHVALAPIGGQGVITLEDDIKHRILFRRFTTSGQFIGVIADTRITQYSSRRNHILACNDSGIFAIQYQIDSYTFYANFYNWAKGTLLRKVKLTERSKHLWSYFDSLHQELNVYKGRSFIFRDGENRTALLRPHWYLYDDRGQLLSAYHAKEELLKDSLRVGGAHTLVMDNKKLLYIDKVQFIPKRNLCRGAPCYCTPKDSQSCFSGYFPLRSPCRSGVLTCSASGQKWEICQKQILPKPEICNNNIDDDCDGKVDENCPISQAIQVLSGHRDYDVANNGQLFILTVQRGNLLGYCSIPGKTTSSFLLTEEEHRASYPWVVMNKKSQLALVTWRDTFRHQPSLPISKLYDRNCHLLKTISWPVKSLKYFNIYTALSDKGYIALAWKDDSGDLHLNILDAVGRSIDNVKAITSKYCKVGSYAISVSLRPSTVPSASKSIQGVISCQGALSDGIYFRTFSLMQSFIGKSKIIFTDNKIHQVPYSSSAIKSPQGYLSRINDKGEFLFYWHNKSKRFYEAVSYSSKGKTHHFLVADKITYNSLFYLPKARISLYGTDFILPADRDGNSPITWYRFSYNGLAKGKISFSSSAGYDRFSFRINDKGNIFMKNSKVIELTKAHF